MDYVALKAEIQNDPVGMGYAALLPACPGLVVAKLNAPTRTAVRPITAAQAMQWAAAGPYSKISDAANNPVSPVRASCMTVIACLLSNQMININIPAVRGMFDAWVSAGVITQTEHDSLIATATVPAGRIMELGLADSVGEMDLRNAGVI